MEVTTKAVQVFGGYGYMRDAKITQNYEGANQVQLLVIARNLQKSVGELKHLNPYIPLEEQMGVDPATV